MSVLVAGGRELGDASEHVFRKLEVTKFEMDLLRSMVTRVADWKGWREEEVILPVSDPYISRRRGDGEGGRGGGVLPLEFDVKYTCSDHSISFPTGTEESQ
jgi:hypothetical protein